LQLPVRDLEGNEVRSILVDDYVFGIEPNVAVLHQALVAGRNAQRRGSASTLTRGEVQGSTRKIRMQKYTGRARQGTIRAPHWRGGGVVFGPHQRSYHQSVPRKVRRLALRSALSDKVNNGQLMVLEDLVLTDSKTKTLMTSLQALSLNGKIVLVTATPNPLLRLASHNLEKVHVALPNGLRVLDIIQADAVVFARDAVPAVTNLLLGAASAEADAA